LFDAFVWVACGDGSGLSTLLEAVARTLDYPGLLARTLEDRRQAVRDLLSRKSVLLTHPSAVIPTDETPATAEKITAGTRNVRSRMLTAAFEREE